jgi:membrane protease YdiL (CAAX protease family)
MMIPHLFDHAFFVLLVMVFPIVDFFSIRKRAALINAGRTDLRMKLYVRILWEGWAMALVLAVLWIALGRTAGGLGLVPASGALVWAGYGLTALICGLLIFQMRVATATEKNRAAVRGQLGDLTFLMPQTLREARTFDLVSVTAGICEELMFRGFVMAYLTAVLGVPLWASILLSSLAFGFAHLYQGPLGMVKSGGVGVVFAILYVMTGSLWAPMIAHAVMDITSGRVTFAALSGKPEESSPSLIASTSHSGPSGQ